MKFLIRNFKSQKALNEFYNAEFLNDRIKKFKWIKIQRALFRLPTYAIKRKLYYNQLPKVKDLSGTWSKQREKIDKEKSQTLSPDKKKIPQTNTLKIIYD